MQVLYIKNKSQKVNFNSYNLQEVGLCSALVRQGFDCDIVYYSDEKGSRKKCIYQYGKNKLNAYFMYAYKVMNNSIYPDLLSKKFLDQYDLVITTEYSQIMTYLLSKLCKEKLALYHGPYKDNRRAMIHKIYDIVFLHSMKKNLKNIFVKSEMANHYLTQKGFENVKTISVGLDTEKFLDLPIDKNTDIGKALMKIYDKKVLLYVGSLEERKNILFLLDVFKEVNDKRDDMILLMIGEGAQAYVEHCYQAAEELGIMQNIIHIKHVEQKNIRYVYEAANVFLLPSKYEIFGMVLLESMYFGIPVISSNNGGSVTLIEDGNNGYIVEEFDKQKWVTKIITLLENELLHKKFSQRSKSKIINSFNWDVISSKLITHLIENKVLGGIL